jgi:hypothetical protein
MPRDHLNLRRVRHQPSSSSALGLSGSCLTQRRLTCLSPFRPGYNLCGPRHSFGKTRTGSCQLVLVHGESNSFHRTPQASCSVVQTRTAQHTPTAPLWRCCPTLSVELAERLRVRLPGLRATCFDRSGSRRRASGQSDLPRHLAGAQHRPSRWRNPPTPRWDEWWLMGLART